MRHGSNTDKDMSQNWRFDGALPKNPCFISVSSVAQKNARLARILTEEIKLARNLYPCFICVSSVAPKSASKTTWEGRPTDFFPTTGNLTQVPPVFERMKEEG